MRWFLFGGGLMLAVLACGAPETPTPTPAAPVAAPAPVKRGKKAGGDCAAYCQKFESCAHVEGWDYDAAECARSCRQFAAHPQGGGIITCFLETPTCVDALGCTMGD